MESSACACQGVNEHTWCKEAANKIRERCQQLYPLVWSLIKIRHLFGSVFELRVLHNVTYTNMLFTNDVPSVEFAVARALEVHIREAYERAPLEQYFPEFPNIAKRFSARRLSAAWIILVIKFKGITINLCDGDPSYDHDSVRLEEFIAGIENQRAAAKNQIAWLPLPIAEEILDNF